MKKIFLTFALGGLLLSTSCDDNLLDTYTPGSLDAETAIKNSTDLSQLMNTVYDGLVQTSEVDFNSVFTDEIGIGYANGGQGINDDFAFLLNSGSDAPNAIWVNHYYTLAMANRVIKYSANFTPTDANDQMLVNRLLAEAYTARAYCHIQLISYFSTNPKDRNALGVQISKDVYDVNYAPPRVTNGEIYDLIDSDLATARTLFDNATATPSSSYISKTFTIAMQARVNALRGDYPQAKVFADEVLASGVSLATFSNYKNVFHTDDNAASSEVIFKLRRLTNQTKMGAVWASVNSTVNGSPFYEMGRSLFNELNTTSLPSATTLQITAVSGTTVTAPGNTLQVGDMFVFNNSAPANAVMNLNGLTTNPANAIVAGKVYYVRSILNPATGTFTLTTDPTVASPTAANFAAANTNNYTTNPISAKTNYGDIRYTVNLHPTAIINPNYQTVVDFRNTDKLPIRKYPGRSDSGNLVNDIKLCRLSEMYFIKAEALVDAGDLPGAAAVLKQIRDNRTNRPQPLQTFANATDAWKAILKERRLEFAYEGYRYIDLKRLGTLANEGISRDARDCEVNGQCTLPASDYRFTMPIPTIVTGTNSLIRAQQNPGYSN